MFKRQLTQTDYFLIAANLLPVAGTWFLGWSPVQVFIAYCLETVIIGLFNLLKMGVVTAIRKTDLWYNNGNVSRVSGVFFMLFFLVHYGMFVCIQTGLFVEVSGIAKAGNTSFFDFFFHWPSYVGPDAWYILAGFAICYAFQFFRYFIGSGEYRTIPLMKLMFQPYLRIFIQQFTVIGGSIFLSFGAGKIFILIFALVKICFEVLIDYSSLVEKGMAGLGRKK
jgi:hypothetical protein